MTYSPFTWADDPAGGTPITAARLNVIEQGIRIASAGNIIYLAGNGIDPTGVADSAPSIQAMLDAANDGDTAVVPSGAVLRVNTSLRLAKAITLRGPGEIRVAGWDGTNAAIVIAATGATIDGINLTNPSLIGATQTGNFLFGIKISGNRSRVINSRIFSFVTGIAVDAAGEFHDIIISNNFIDVYGGGSGPSSTDALGEDRGDGIVCWGAAAIVTGNRVNAISGRDCRVGIHFEALSNYETTAYAHADSLVTCTGNLVTGKFRRGIASEGVSYCNISSNTVADSTWWGIAIIGNANFCSVVGNTIKWTRLSTDNQGSAYSPIRSAIMLYNNGTPTYYPTVTNNNIHAAAGASIPFGIAVAGDNTAGMFGANISHNSITDETGTMQDGVHVGQHVNDMAISNNLVNHFAANGIYVWGGAGFAICGNRLLGPASPGSSVKGIFLDAVANKQVVGNFITTVNIGVSAPNGSIMTMFASNVINSAALGFDLAGTTGTTSVTGNAYSAVTTAVSGAPTGYVNVGNSA